MIDADDYLQEGFDPRSVTVPRLRSILVTHQINVPSTAKKSQLVELVNEYVMPQVPKLRAQRARAKRSSLGIVNAGSAEDNGIWSDDYDLEAPSIASRRSMSPRKSSKIKKEEEDTGVTPYKSARKRSSRSVSRQPPSNYDENEVPQYEPPKSSRRSRSRRTVTPSVKTESEPEPEEEATPMPAPRAKPESVFSSDNPFQSASSPSYDETPTQRRRTAGEDIQRSEKSVRQRTDGQFDQYHIEQYQDPEPEPETEPETEPDTEPEPEPEQFGFRQPSPRPYRAPKSQPDIFQQSFQQTPKKSLFVPKTRHRAAEFTLDEPIDAGEEFTPDAQLELEEAARRGEATIAPLKKPAGPTRKTSLMVPFFVLILSLFGAYAAWYRQEKIAVGYCGLGRPATQLIPPEIPVPDSLLPLIEPQCEPCPSHAYCYQDFSVRCHNDFILKPHPLSLRGFLPFPPTCEPDGEKAKRVQAVANKAIEELRERRAKFECGELVDEEGQRVDSPAIAAEELKQTISKQRNKRLNSAEFEDLWVAAIGEITTRDEVIIEMETTTEPSNSTHIPISKLSSSSLARLPLTCAFKRSIRLGLARYRFPIGLLTTLVLFVFYVRARYRRHIATSAQIPALVDHVLERLANQKELGEEDLDDPWLFLPNLRDDVLRSIHSLSERERIWQRVKPVVELNSNVRTSQREGRSGEIGRAWEWIGPVKGDAAVRRRRSGRASLLPESRPESPESSDVAISTLAKEQLPRNVIEKPRPIY